MCGRKAGLGFGDFRLVPAALPSSHSRRGQSESERQFQNQIWQRNGGKRMKTKKIPVPIPLPQLLCQIVPATFPWDILPRIVGVEVTRL